jgi:hypothetical protein
VVAAPSLLSHLFANLPTLLTLAAPSGPALAAGGLTGRGGGGCSTIGVGVIDGVVVVGGGVVVGGVVGTVMVVTAGEEALSEPPLARRGDPYLVKTNSHKQSQTQKTLNTLTSH